MVMGSAFDILSAAWPPRASFVNYPLGHQAGKPFDIADQKRLVTAALHGLEVLEKPGMVNVLECSWGKIIDHCQQVGAGPGAIRQKRDSVLRYQTEEDMKKAVERYGEAALGVVSAEAMRQKTFFS